MKMFIHHNLLFMLIMCFCLSMTAFAQDDNSELINAVMEASTAEVIQSFPSPDEMYAAEVTVYPCTLIDEQEYAYELLELVNNSTGEREFVAEQFISCGGLGGYGLWVTRWTQSGSHFFYTDAREGTPDGLATGWVRPVWRVSVADLELQRLGQALFSPDGSLIAIWSGESISIMEPESDETTDFALVPEGLQIIQVTWLPDASGILYIQADAPFASTMSAVTFIDIETMEQTVILETP